MKKKKKKKNILIIKTGGNLGMSIIEPDQKLIIDEKKDTGELNKIEPKKYQLIDYEIKPNEPYAMRRARLEALERQLNE